MYLIVCTQYVTVNFCSINVPLGPTAEGVSFDQKNETSISLVESY